MSRSKSKQKQSRSKTEERAKAKRKAKAKAAPCTAPSRCLASHGGAADRKLKQNLHTSEPFLKAQNMISSISRTQGWGYKHHNVTLGQGLTAAVGSPALPLCFPLINCPGRTRGDHFSWIFSSSSASLRTGVHGALFLLLSPVFSIRHRSQGLRATHPSLSKLMIQTVWISEALPARPQGAGQGCLPSGVNHSPSCCPCLHKNPRMGLPVLLPGRRRRASSSMRAALALLPLLAAAQALHRGKAYVREKVCQEYKILGKENFRTLTIIDTSRKYSNGTLQEISHLVREIVSLAETCCADGADPSCYDAGATALSEKSCAADSPFPAHPGAARCCGQQGLERKLCLAALRHPPRPLPRFLQPSDSELCHAFRLEPREFADRFLYEYASSYSQAPLPVLLASTTTFLSMVSTCCISSAPTACFLKEKRERKTLSLLTLMSNRICSRFSAYGKDKASFSSLTSLAQKIPNASFEELLPLAEDAAEVACQCCDSMAEDCMQKKLLEHTARVCSALSARDERLASCCQGKNLMENHFCILAMPPAPAARLPELPEPTNKELCAKEGALHATRFLFEVARRYPSLPEAVLAKLYDTSGKFREECCSSKDPSACWDSKRQRIAAELFPFLAKAEQLCGQFHKLPFLEFKKRLRDSLAQSEPSSAPLEQLLEQRASFASSCCLPDAPPLLCASKVTSELGELCQGDSCLLG